MRLINDGVVDREGVTGLARRLAVSQRHLNRVLAQAVGAPPVTLARSRRAQTARLLVETTGMPFGEVAFAAGFTSIRQFNDTMRQIFSATPSQLRAAHRGGTPQPPGGLALRLTVRGSHDPSGVLKWLAHRAVPAVEECSAQAYRRVLMLPGGPATLTLHPTADHVDAVFQLATVADLGTAVARCRRLFDLDADPRSFLPVLAADPVLAPLSGAVAGLRLPGTLDAAETALRIALGPRAAARAATLGAPLSPPDGALTRIFPDPATLSGVNPESLGLAPTRARTVRLLAERLATGELVLDEGADRPAIRHALLATPGMSPALVEEISLYALGDPDAFPITPAAAAGARRLGLPTDPTGLTRHASRWRPWRGYLAHLLWQAGHPTRPHAPGPVTSPTRPRRRFRSSKEAGSPAGTP